MAKAELQQDAFFLQAAMGWINGESSGISQRLSTRDGGT